MSPLRRETFGELQCTVIQTGKTPTIPVILCHGYGAPGDDLVSLAQPLCDWLGDAADLILFVFPEAPLSPPELAMYGGRAWWPINMAKLLAASQTGRFEELHEVEPPGHDEATDKLVDCINAILKSIPDYKAMLLGGFSQGAMVTMNAALRSEIPAPAILAQFSGTVVCRPQWQHALETGRLKDTLIIQSHGRQDNVLPFTSAGVLHDMLVAAHVKTKWMPFDGPHTIPMDALSEIAVKLADLSTP